MKRLFFALFVCLPLLVAAQKIAVVDYDAVLNAMPQKAQAEALLQSLSDQYQSEYAMLQDEFNKKYADYQRVANDASIGSAIKERRMQEIQENNRKIDNFMAGVNDDLKKKEAELMQPIKDRISETIHAVGSENGFSVILFKNQAAFIGPDVIDITEMVKQRL